MIYRLVIYLFLLLLGFSLGYVLPHGLGAWLGACLGLIAVSVISFLIQAKGEYLFSEWIKSADIINSSGQSGRWGETAYQVRRLFKQKEVELNASKESLRQFLSAIQASPNGVVLLDKKWHIIWSNKTASWHLGIDPDRDVKQLIGFLLRNPVFSEYVRANSFENEIIVEGRENRSDHPQKIAIQVFPYGDGSKLLLSRDITLLEQAEAMRRDFVANVSHEIRTPLTVLVGFVETMLNLSLSATETNNYLKLMSQQALRMQALVQDLLTLSNLEGSPLPSHYDWHNFDLLWSNCLEDANGLMKVLNQKDGSTHMLAFHLPPEFKDYEIAGSFDEIKSAFSNLVSNALRYTPSGGKVTVTWRQREVGYEFSVVDTGDGIATDHIPRLTERFYRVDRSRSRDTGGTGLGLAIVKHVIQRHDGQLHIESKLNSGSIFSLIFPSSRLRQKLL
jgi:two-component system phosphate regulon sensor histidine kinase PhoR